MGDVGHRIGPLAFGTVRQASATSMTNAAELVRHAHKTGKAADVRAATDQLRRALQLEGWI